MGKGDIKSKRGKINRGTSGVRRQKKKTASVVLEKPTVAPKKKAAKKKATKKAASKKTAAKKTTPKKAPAKKKTPKKTITKKKAED